MFFNTMTCSRRLMAGFGLAGLTLLLTVWAGWSTAGRLIERENWTARLYSGRVDLSHLRGVILDAEAGLRGYVMTGDRAYLAPYNDGAAQSMALLDSLKRRMEDDPAQQQRLVAIRSLVDAIMLNMKLTIAVRDMQGFPAAQRVVANGSGQVLIDQLRMIIGQTDRQQAFYLDSSIAKETVNAKMVLRIIMWGGFVGALLVGLIGWLVGRSLIRQIGDAVAQMQSSSVELKAAANQQVSGTKEQATAMTEMATTISELLASSRQIAENAQAVAQIAEQTAGAAGQGHETVELAYASIAAIRRQVDQIVAHMLALGKKSQEIGAVLDIVAEMAEQTNILAINATIEAAGAGDSGRRFAVVADEIRKLADRVGGSTKEIRVLIDDVRSAVNTTVMATETGSKSVDAGTRLFDDVAASFKKIGGLVVSTTDQARGIELSTKQQSTAVEQVNVAIASVAQASKETEVSSTQTLMTASQLAGLSGDLGRVIGVRGRHGAGLHMGFDGLRHGRRSV